MKNTDEKIFTPIEVAEKLRKSLYKMVKKSIDSKKNRNKAKQIVADVLDPNYIAEVNPKDVPEDKTSVAWKSEKKGGDEKNRSSSGQ